MTSSFTWLESVNSTMDEIKTLIVNQEVRSLIMLPRSPPPHALHLYSAQPVLASFCTLMLASFPEERVAEKTGLDSRLSSSQHTQQTLGPISQPSSSFLLLGDARGVARKESLPWRRESRSAGGGRKVGLG